MAMAMTEDYYAGDLDDVVHRLLPREILADVGVVVAPPSRAARRGDDHAAVVEGLAAHLVRILGLDAARGRQRAPPPHLQHVHQQHRRAGMGNGGSRAPVGGVYGGAERHAPPGFCWNGAAPCLPRFEMAAAVSSHPPARCHGTGVFLPRVDAYAQNRASSTSPSRSPRNGAEAPRVQKRDAAVAIAMRRRQQQQQLELRAMAAEMQRQREAFAAAFQLQGCPPGIAPPQQWTY